MIRILGMKNHDFMRRQLRHLLILLAGAALAAPGNDEDIVPMEYS